jgi:hypothetical protein
VRGRGHFPSDEAATKLNCLVLRNMTIKWPNPPISWHAARTQLALQFENRFAMRPTHKLSDMPDFVEYAERTAHYIFHR